MDYLESLKTPLMLRMEQYSIHMTGSVMDCGLDPSKYISQGLHFIS